MEKKIVEKKEKAALKCYKYTLEEKHLLAFFWRKRMKKFIDMEKKSAALIKRQLASKGIKKLNIIKI